MADACEANMKLSTKIRKLQETIDELEGSLEEWRLDFKALEVENKRLREALEAAPEPGTGVLGAMEYKGTYELIESVAYDRYAEWYDGVRFAALKGE